MHLGIVGTGSVGATLGRRFAQVGHLVVYGSRDPGGDKVQQLLHRHPGRTKASPLGELAERSDLLLLAVPYAAVEETVARLGDIHGKILVDATNPLLPKLAGLAVGTDTSAGEQVQALAVGAQVVKAFNTVGVDVMADPVLSGHRALLTVCGDEADPKQVVIGLAEQIGFEAIDFGPLANARYTEPLAMVWIQLAHVLGHGTDIALALARR